MMDERAAEKIIEATRRVRAFAALALVMLSVFLLFAALGQMKALRYIGSGMQATNTISVSGQGEVFAVPDTAQFSFTVQHTAKDVATAQAAAAADENTIVNYLKSQGVADTDIQTTDYQANPQYEWQTGASVCPAGMPCPPGGHQVLVGYQVSETISVKVKDTTKAGALLSGVGGKGASNISGLSFTVADQQVLENKARDKAIQQAKAKAATLAGSLGVSLVRLVSFSENGAQPLPYARETMSAAGASVASTPQLPGGQNKITSNVTLMYEIQ